MADDFLLCRNCINWGQPWLLGRKTIICEQKTDINGKAYTSQHPACKYFIPIQGVLPQNLQKIRLFVQTLDPNQLSYFAWALAQASLLLPAKDANGNRLALGDQVSFRLGLHGHTGTVEGVDMQHKHAIVINSPAFVNSNLSLLSSSVTKISKDKAKEIFNESFPDDAGKLQWHIDSLIQEITLLRARKDTWAKKDYSAVLLYERQLVTLEQQVRQTATMASI